jgi:hypothetical protein
MSAGADWNLTADSAFKNASSAATGLVPALYQVIQRVVRSMSS